MRVYFPALGEETTRKVTMIGRSIDPTNRTFKIEMDVDSKNGKLKPNLLAEVMLSDLLLQDVIGVPLELVQQEVNGKNFVYIASPSDSSMIAKKVYVETGEATDNLIQVTSGLTKGQILITRGARAVSDGDILIPQL